MPFPVVGQAVSSQELAWLLPIGLSVLGVVVQSVVHGVRVRDLRYRNHGDQRRKVRAAIEGEHIIPSLANFVCSVRDDAIGTTEWLLGVGEPDCVEQVGNRLQQVAFLSDLESLSNRYEDLLAVDGFYEASIAWAQRRGVVAPVAVGLGVGPTYRVVVGELAWIPDWLSWALTVFAIALAAAGVACWYGEARSLNRLAELGNKYG